MNPKDDESNDNDSTSVTTTESGEDKARGGLVSRSRSALNLHIQERLLSCGTYGALMDDEDVARMGRRPSLGSTSLDGSSIPESDEGGYFGLRRVWPFERGGGVNG